MKLIFLGTGGYHPNERRHTASVLLPEEGIALDAGTGFFRVQGRLKTPGLDVFLTHGHLDHICGLTFILVPMLRGDISQVRVFGSQRCLDGVRNHLLADALFPVEPDFEWHELNREVTLRSGAILRTISLDHPGGCLGFRIDWPDRSLAYITDTTAPGEYVDFIRGVDLLIHECYFPDELADWALKTGHSAATPVAEVARDAGVGRLLLVHVDPQRTDDDPIGMPNVRAVFPNAEIAEDLMELEF